MKSMPLINQPFEATFKKFPGYSFVAQIIEINEMQWDGVKILITERTNRYSTLHTETKKVNEIIEVEKQWFDEELTGRHKRLLSPQL